MGPDPGGAGARRLTVLRLSVTPVRSLGLQHPESVQLTEHGVAEDRRYLLTTPDGRIFDAIKHGPLLRVGAELADNPERLTLRFPDGHRVTGEVRLGDPETVEVYGRRFSVRPVVGPWVGALADYAGRDLRLVRSERQSGERDRAPVSLVSQASVHRLEQQLGAAQALDARRFRMLIEVTGATAHEEDAWIGRSVRIGAAVIRITSHVARCAITTLDPATGQRDLPTLHAIKAYRGMREGRHIDFGVYADVVTAGPIRRGDSVRVEPWPNGGDS